MRRRPLTRPFSVQQRGAGGVERPHNPRSDAIRTCFRSAERVTALFVCLARNALSRLRIIRRRMNCFRRHLSFSDAPRPDTMEGILLGDVVDSGAHVLVPCCPEAVGCALKDKRWRSHLIAGKKITAQGGLVVLGPRRSPGAILGGPCGGGLGGFVAGAVRGPQWLRARGPRVGCGRPTGRWLARSSLQFCSSRCEP